MLQIIFTYIYVSVMFTITKHNKTLKLVLLEDDKIKTGEREFRIK